MGVKLNQVYKTLKEYIEKEKAEFLPKFFQAYPGGYGEGDKFLGIRVPNQRIVAKRYFNDISLDTLSSIIKNKFHEMRLTGLIMLVNKYEKSKSDHEKEILVEFYLNHFKNINNWDLVDSTASYILGDFLLDKDRTILYKMAGDDNFWIQRISIIATLAFIKKQDYSDTFRISEILLNHPHDLIHKAVGWMLREVGNRNLEAELEFLDKHTPQMPRTMLRYAIEKFPNDLRLEYLKNR